MGALLSIPLLGSVGGLATTVLTSCVAGATFFCTSKAASAFCKSCNCNSSVATRIGFSIMFALNSMLAWLMLSPWAIHKLESWSYDYIKMSCKDDKCYGVLAVHRICFALALFHAIIGLMLIGVHDTRTKRAAIQNGWWGPKILAWIVLVAISFFIPNGFFMFWANYVSLIGSTVFILIGLVLLIDFAHTFSEKCIENYLVSESRGWMFILIGSTLTMYGATIALTVIDYVYFCKSGCGLNQFFVTFNLVLSIIVSVMSISPPVQEANPNASLIQSGIVTTYTTYLVTSAIANHKTDCNPLTKRSSSLTDGMIVLGALFTFLAIAYSTSRAATSSKAMVGKDSNSSSRSQDVSSGGYAIIRDQPTARDSPRTEAIRQAIEEGAMPASALDEDDDSDSEDGDQDLGVENDDERRGTRYNYAWFHVIFVLATMYVALLLTNWKFVTKTSEDDVEEDGTPVRIGQGTASMWIRVVSGWVCLLLYAVTLIAPVLFPDRFE